ncbi:MULTISPECIES: WxL domain-containing protein [Bacillus cereus group]|uniref:WxL domain-containing protein n=1 Tax=Bacillus cytotoxicus (strain DSM 22905 / CIP 110041 / 391-98 / NVH 391-98) TaxID=315749 RepID=A7GLN7_BACCN|nr:MULTISPECIES: WxL domain-containing protein [Bacillus cereus group]ABS21045.1 conserved hypothetical protein [Bacillus cytotoxicus NVH 391-98]AWC27695.1 WxL domain-containing protein [Bacillus cytotoxicus]AWC40928.1 WxL domain-containing protein [Bacillus cytotoxicus]AWC43780.1 WxL domain-containing protein [Bacillus cytotoxicus]AWC48859.1 WxL domain-containing protein [Bacillus cytotoxicus]
MKLTKVALAGVVSFSAVLAAGAPAFAEEAAATMNSKAFIKFQENTDHVDPINPNNPGDNVEPVKPDDPNNPHEQGTNGPLSIDYVSNFKFEEQKASGNNEVYYANLDTVVKKGTKETLEVPNYIQVTDNRGTNKGWKLTVKQNEQFQTEKGVELEGAVLTLKNGTLQSASGNAAPTTNQEGIQLTPGQASDVITAKENQGMGTWTNAFGATNDEAKKSVELSVPGKAKKEKAMYTTSLTWELKETPM